MFITQCPKCGGDLELHSYVLMAGGKRPRKARHGIMLCDNGFTVCDDLWGTKYENGDQSTTDEKFKCLGCGHISPLRMEEDKED